ncbi:MAG: sugar transferase, partial [bacterium]|nr:sugar transferase [bacterium]
MAYITTPSPRVEVLEELYARYGASSDLRRRLRCWRKRYAWQCIIGGARLLKRSVDVLVASAGFLVLAPVFVIVALCIKCTDGGPIIFVQKRVGRFGREFDFPKFRSMVVNAEKLKDQLLTQSHHGTEGVTFKMKHD